jgi:hypothetical protein
MFEIETCPQFAVLCAVEFLELFLEKDFCESIRLGGDCYTS